ncbi:MAG TPA: hypothetical protein VGG39_26690 [Polyangiaceae bacterium]|jgi:hypothetical protein
MFSLNRFAAGALATVVVAACSPSSSSGGSSDGVTGNGPCDPLSPPPTSLSNVLGVGEDAQGTLYVADEPQGLGEPRVFVGAEAAGPLVRQEVIGSGENGSGQYTLAFVGPGASDGAAQSLLLDTSGGAATEMALGPADSKSFLGGPGEAPLTVVDPGTVTGLAVVNLSGTVAYVADVSDGSVIVVTNLVDIVTPSPVRLFYGSPPALAERSIVSFDQSLSGYPTIAFQVGTATYTMAIGGTFGLDGGGPGPGTLATGSTSIGFTLRQPTPTTLDGFTFSCLAGD